MGFVKHSACDIGGEVGNHSGDELRFLMMGRVPGLRNDQDVQRAPS